MNIPMALSGSILTIIPLCMSTFSIPIFSYLSLNIFIVLLMSLSIVLFEVLFYMLPFSCYAFVSVDYVTTFQFYHGFFLPTSYSGYKIFFLFFSSIPFITVSFFLCFILVTFSTFVFVSLHLHISRHAWHHTFLNCSPETNSCLWFSCVLGTCPVCCNIPVSLSI